MGWRRGLGVLAAMAIAQSAAGQSYDEMLEQMGRPFDPVRIAGDLYVGTHDVAAYLWTGPEGHIDRYRRYLDRARARFDEALTAERGAGEA